MVEQHNATQDDYIADINIWLKKRVNNNKTNHLNPVIIRYRYIEKKIDEICKELDITKKSIKLVTLRSSFCKEQKYLRPIYSKPDALKGYFVEPKRQVPFSFEGKLKDIFAGVKTTVDIRKNILPEIFTAYYALNPDYSCKKDGCSIQTPNDFATRIDTFWKGMALEEDEKYSELKKIAKNSNMNCIFAGLNKNKNVSKLVELEHIVAIYFKKKGYELKNEKLQQIKDISYKLFEEINLIAKLDYNLFKKDGLEIVTDKIIPVFSNTSIAPADKIATAIRVLENHLKNHLVGRQIEKSPPKVFYLSASFEQKENNVFFPHLNVYPLCYRSDYPIGSYQVAHKYIPSATKFLLYKYLTSNNIKVKFGENYSDNDIAEQEYIEAEFDEDFKKLFYDNKLFGDENSELNYSNWYKNIWSEEYPHQLHMVSHDYKWKNFSGKTPWNVLNRFLEPNEENNSIVAFIVEGNKLPDENGCRCRTFPRGILAIESSHVDAFSDEDVKALRSLAKTISLLIKQITHRNSPLDFRSNISHAFDNEYNFLRCKDWAVTEYMPRVKRLMLAVYKIDVKELHKLCEKIDNAISQNPKETEAIYNTYEITDKDFEQIKNLSYKFEVYEDKDILDEKKATKIIDNRFARLFEWFSSYEPKNVSNGVINFLEACPENFVLAGFFMSLGQALGDRVSTEIPDFSFMSPGYSASSMFMASVDGELRQVVKLSSKKKLEQERNNYSKYVRYCTVHSARIPQNGYAFDTRGKKGKDNTETEEDIPYGALISDLVSAGGPKEQNYILTLLGIIASLFLGHNTEIIPEIEVVKNKLQILFNTGLKLWKEKGFTEVQTIQRGLRPFGGIMVRQAFRLPQTWDFKKCCKEIKKNSSDEEKYQFSLYKANSKFNTIINRNKNENFIQHRLTNEFIPKGHGTNAVNHTNKIVSIGHGDMNARNLTWSGWLESFFMIDFEHVGNYFIGADQYRLAVNLVVDIFSEIFIVATKDILNFRQPAEKKTSSKLYTILKALCASIDYSVEVITGFCNKLAKESAVTQYSEILDEFESKNCDRYLCSIIIMLFRTLNDIFIREGAWGERQWLMEFYGYVLFCAVLKEFDYSCRSIDYEDEVVQNIISELNEQHNGIHKVNSFELLKIIYSKSEEKKTKYLRGMYFKHFISAKMLYLLLFKNNTLI